MTKITLIVYTLVLFLIVALAKVDAEARQLEGSADKLARVNSSY